MKTLVAKRDLILPEKYDLANMFSEYTDEYNNITYNLLRTLTIKGIDNPQTGYVNKYRTKESDNWHIVSYNHYGTTRLWWLLCKVNGISAPLTEPMPDEILIPTTDLISSIIEVIRMKK